MVFEPIDAVAFESLIYYATDPGLDGTAANRESALAEVAIPHPRHMVDEVVHCGRDRLGLAPLSESVDVRQQGLDLTCGQERLCAFDPCDTRRVTPCRDEVGDVCEVLDRVEVVHDLVELVPREAERATQRFAPCPDPLGAVSEQGDALGSMGSHETKVPDEQGESLLAIAHRPVDEGPMSRVLLSVLADDINGEDLRLAPGRVVSPMARLGATSPSFRVLADAQAAPIDSDSDMFAFKLEAPEGASVGLAAVVALRRSSACSAKL